MSSSYRFNDQGYFLWIILLLWHQPVIYCQRGHFPDLRDLSALKPIISSSTCGATEMDYCRSFRSNNSLQTCSNSTCTFACCSRCGSSKPLSTDLGKFSLTSGVASGEPRNGSSVNSYRFQGNSYVQPLILGIVLNYVRTGVTLSVWIKQKAGNRGTIISKDQLSFANIFHLIIQDYNLTFHYVPIGRNSSLTVTYTLIQSQSEKLHPDEWHFITVSIIDKGLLYYIDGELMTANSVTLSGSINDPGGIVRIGQSYAGSDQYEGLMQDVFVYTQALTNREVVEAFTGVLPPEYVASHCRCPPTHPKIYPGGPTSAPPRCLRNVNGSLDDAVSRLADTAHPVELATDGDTLGFWLSELTENATIDIELSYSRLQVFYIVLNFYGPQPGAILIERSIDGGKMFQPWQYFAEDCKASFQLENNGQLSEPDDVNCIQYSNPLLNGGTITFQTEYSPSNGLNITVRPFGPGCDNVYCSEKLLQFIKATNVRFHFYNHTLVTNARHRYYGLERILVAGRCECFGHAVTYRNVEGTEGQLGKCVCDCLPSTNTEGDNCNRCQPLYNNKPFQRGNIGNPFPCIKCECNAHADSCVYNQFLDSHPSSRTLGGGGVCVNCQHNTTGRFCEVCKDRYYRASGKNLTDKDVCLPCGCEGPGVQSGKLDCVKDDLNSSVLAGQCNCKANTMGRQCNLCKDGFYDLQASHAAGCIPSSTVPLPESTYKLTTTTSTTTTVVPTTLVKNVRITEGDDFTLNCTTEINTHEWSREEGKPDISEERTLKDGESISSSATVKDSGKYLCEIDNERYIFNVSVKVLVKVEMVISVLSYTFTPELQNKSSQVYKETEKNFTAEMDKVYNNTPGYVRTEVLNFTEGSVKVDFRVIIVFVATDPKNESTIIDKKATTGQTIIKEAENGLVSRLRVKPEVTVKTPPPEPRGVGFYDVKPDQIGIQWMVPDGFKSFDILSYEVEHWIFGKMDKRRKKLPAPEAKTEYSYRIQDLEPETTYMIRVAAINVHGSNYNEEKGQKTPPAPFPYWVIALIVLFAVAAIIGAVVCIRRRMIQRRNQQHEEEALGVMDSPKKFESVLNQDEKIKGLNLKFTNASYRPTDVDWTEIPFESIKIMDELGSGAFGVVYKGEICRENGNIMPCAVKALKASATDEEIRDLYNELEIMSNIGSHPNLVNLLGACTKDGNLLVVLEIAENGSLIEFLKKIRSKNENYEGEGAVVSNGLSTDMKLSIALDVAKGMAHLASHRCIHRDLAARNVLLGKNYVAKVADYGMARDVYEQLMYKKETQGKLPVKWMAIESLETYVFTVESDVWSYGVLLWEMETGGLKPYPGLTTTELMAELKKGYRLEQPNGCSNEMYQVMMDCWHSNPSLRPTFDQLVEQLEKMSVSS